jgi:hypothetical protein
MRRICLTSVLILAACGQGNDSGSGLFSSGAAKELDQQAIAKDLLPDPSKLDIAGRYERRSELGTDKFCATSGRSHAIGVLAVFGPESKCEARGTAVADGTKVRITLEGKEDCSFSAEFDGVSLRFPGALEPGCASYCSPRASLGGTSYFFVEQGDTGARKALGRDFEKLCP